MKRTPRTGGLGAAVLCIGALTVLSALLAGCSGPSAGTGGGALRDALSPTPALPVGHSGRWLVDGDGRVLLLHGVNEVVKTAPWDPAALGFSDADAAWLAANGFDVVRLGVMASAALPAPGQVDTGYLGQLAAVARDLAGHGVLTLLDLHQDGWGPAFPGMDGFPPWMTVTDGAPDQPAPFPDEYRNPAVQQAFASFWRDAPGPGGTGLQEDDATLLGALARTFGSMPSLLGYDVLNEPWPGTDAGPCSSGDGCASLQAGELRPFYDKADRAVRAADTTHLVLVEPFVQFDGGDVPVSVPLPGGDERSGLSFHAYGSSSGTGTGSGPGGADGRALVWAQRTGGAVVVTEWGATGDASAIAASAGAFDSALLSWIYWTFDDCCGPAPGSDSLVRSRSGPPAGDNANTAVVGALVRPHPWPCPARPRRSPTTPGPAGSVSPGRRRRSVGVTSGRSH
jgi:endoglycosylceramidase